MKKIIAFLLCLCLAAGSFGVLAAGEEDVTVRDNGYDWQRFADAGITLNVYNWGMYISNGEDDSLDVVKAFENLTGIKVNYTTFDSNESMYAKLKSGGGSYDIVIPSDYMIGKMIAEDMLAPLNYENIPNYELIDDAYKNPAYDATNAYSVPYMWGLVGLIYNTTMVDEADLAQGWGLLWNDKYTGQILMFNNSRDAFAIAAKRLGYSLNPTSTEEITEEAQLLKDQKSLVQAYVMDECYDKMIGGEAALAPYYVGDGMVMMEDNPDLAMLIPKEGANQYVDAMCIPKDSKNQEAAEMFINFMCETEVALANVEYICYSTPQMEVKEQLDEETTSNELMYPAPEVLEKCETFNVLPDEVNTAMDAAWSSVRSYESNGGGWMMIVLMVILVIAIVFTFWSRANKKKKREL